MRRDAMKYRVIHRMKPIEIHPFAYSFGFPNCFQNKMKYSLVFPKLEIPQGTDSILLHPDVRFCREYKLFIC